jgi:hypothetical protein
MGWEFFYEKTWLPAPTPNPNPPAAPLKDIGPASVGGFVSSSGTVSIVAGGPYQYMLGFPALIDAEVGLQLPVMTTLRRLSGARPHSFRPLLPQYRTQIHLCRSLLGLGQGTCN